MSARWSLRIPRKTFSSIEPRGTSFITRRPLAQQTRSSARTQASKRQPRPSNATSRKEQSVTSPTREQQGKTATPEHQDAAAQTEQNAAGRNTQLAQTLAQSDSSDLVAPVRIPDDPDGVLPRDHPAMAILGNSSLVIQRQLELMNVMLGFEQANRYIIMDGNGQTLGYIAEQDHGIGRTMARQFFRTHRSFTTHIFDAQQREVLRIHRPFAYINSRIRIYDPVPEAGFESEGALVDAATAEHPMAQTSPLKLEDMRIIGEAQQQWAPLRRKYNLFFHRELSPPREDNTPRIESGERPTSETTALTESTTPERAIEAGMVQFANVDEPFLSWDFTLRAADSKTIGNVNRNFRGFAREIFTDTGVYALRMDSAAQQNAALESSDSTDLVQHESEGTALTLDQRAVLLATAVSIDFDYFSRHSGVGGGGFMPFFWPMGGGATAEGGAAAGAAGAAEGVGAAEGAAGAVGSAASRGLGTGAGAAAESGIAGAGTMAGYEAMQRGVYGTPDQQGNESSAPPPANDLPGQTIEQSENRPGNDDVWGADDDPWSKPPSTGGDGDGGGGGGWMDTISDFFGGD